MKIGKTTPSGAFYTMPEANNRFAKKEDIDDVSSAVVNLSGQVGSLETDVEAVQDALEEFDTMIPTPETTDEGKVLTANDSGGYELESAGGGLLVPIPTQADDGKVLTANDSGGYDLETPLIPIPATTDDGKVLTANDSGGYELENPAVGLQNLVDGVNVGSVRGIATKANVNGGTNSFAIGENTSATGMRAFACGQNSTADGENGVAMGSASQAQEYNTIAIGSSNICAHNYSTAVGYHLESGAPYQHLFGRYNKVINTMNCVIIGCGTSSNKLNALVIKNDGSFTFGNNITLTLEQIAHLYSIVNSVPSTDGTYKLQCTVTNGTPAFSWVADV